MAKKKTLGLPVRLWFVMDCGNDKIVTVEAIDETDAILTAVKAWKLDVEAFNCYRTIAITDIPKYETVVELVKA